METIFWLQIALFSKDRTAVSVNNYLFLEELFSRFLVAKIGLIVLEEQFRFFS